MTLAQNNRVLRRLDLQPYAIKVRTWAKETPVPPGVRLTNSAFDSDSVETDGHGNIVEMPVLVGKPCFGIPTAYLRHGRAAPRYVARRKENMHNSRCDRCEIREACLKAIRERCSESAQADEECASLLGSWAGVGGFNKGGFPVALRTLKTGHWSRLVEKLASCEFSSANDDFVVDAWRLKEREAVKKDEGTRRTKLRKAWKQRRELGLLLQGLDEGWRLRSELLIAKLGEGDASLRYLRRFPTTSVERLVNSWWGREYAQLTGKKVNPNSIANCLIERSRHLGKSHSVLRDAVKFDLRTIKMLESDAAYNGGTPVWPKFRHPSLIQPPTLVSG